MSRVLVACECSGVVREAFRAKGHDTLSVDIKPAEDDSPDHVIDDVIPWLRKPWDLVIAFPPCTDLAAVNSNLLRRKYADGSMLAGFGFFMACYHANTPRVAVENPVGVIPRFFRPADQWIDPWMWGEDYMKKTGLWLRGLPVLIPDLAGYPGARPWVGGQRAAADPDGIRRHKPKRGGHRDPTVRARFWPGIARAMAHQWTEP